MSAIVLALGLTAGGATPFIVQSASASAAYDPIPGCDANEVCDAGPPETTVTVTTTLPTPGGEDGGQTDPGNTEAPETTITKTVTASPTKTTKAPKPTKTSSPPQTTPESTPTQNPQPLPSQNIEVPPTTPATTPTPEESVELPAIAPSDTPTAAPSQTEAASTTEEEVLELRRAAPEFDQSDLTQKLSIPALVLVLLALFAVLIFEGRLRRMAHAAAVRKAGPPIGPTMGPQMTSPMGGRPDMPPPGGGYPAGPGYAAAGFPAPAYPGGTAYAPIISFVPVQTYPSGPPQYGYQDPNHPYPPQGYVQEPDDLHQEQSPPEPVVLHPDEFDSYSEPPASRERDPFEPLVPPTPPPADIPPGGSERYDGGPEQPLGPASAAEAGDSEPWQSQEPGSLFRPVVPPDPDAPRDYTPPPYVPADEDVTAVQPLPEPPPQAVQEQVESEPTKEMPEPKRRRFGRKK